MIIIYLSLTIGCNTGRIQQRDKKGMEILPLGREHYSYPISML